MRDVVNDALAQTWLSLESISASCLGCCTVQAPSPPSLPFFLLIPVFGLDRLIGQDDSSNLPRTEMGQNGQAHWLRNGKWSAKNGHQTGRMDDAMAERYGLRWRSFSRA
jgi:hypothetical protein